MVVSDEVVVMFLLMVVVEYEIELCVDGVVMVFVGFELVVLIEFELFFL